MNKTIDCTKVDYGYPPLMEHDVPMPPVKMPKKKMNFDKYYKLNEPDLKEILAEYFNVTIDNVSVKIVPVSVGYGVMEHEEDRIEVIVKEDKI